MSIGFYILIFLFSCAQKESNTEAIRPVEDTATVYAGYKWEEVLPFGNGSFQEEWKPGSFPLGITPVKAFNDKLWMIGQKASWSSADGIHWEHHPKKDWGERISLTYVYFKNRMWMYPGMKYQERELTNDIWSSSDGINWERSGNAAWKPRKGFGLVVFKDKLWLFGGAANVTKDFLSTSFYTDTWSSEDGINWKLEANNASWPSFESNAIVFKDTLYLIGGKTNGEVWRSSNGIDWEKIVNDLQWKQRHDYGGLVYDNKIWIYGGRDTSTNHTAAAKNDVWFSTDGIKWTRQTEHAPWTVRSGANSIVFNDKIWIYSGKHTGGKHNWGGDVWVMSTVK